MAVADKRLLQQFSDSLLLEKGLSSHTVSAYESDIRAFASSLLQSSATQTTDTALLLKVSQSEVMAYLSVMTSNGSSTRSAARLLSALRQFYAWAVRGNLMRTNPTSLIRSPSLGRPLPKTLTESQVQALLDAPDTSETLGLRDRAMLETLYACGLRVSELVSLTIDQVDLNKGVLNVWGKGRKERLVPMGDAAMYWIDKYQRSARAELQKAATSDLFLSTRGCSMTRQTFWHRIRLHGVNAGISQLLSPHTLRHAFATHLVNHNADLRVVQMLLGHSSLSTTQIYTYVATERLKKLHEQHHPRG